MNYYKAKEFSKLTSVTIRTLHYYDEIGLLKPSHTTTSNHRLYTDQEVQRLKQITTLQHMGLSLEEIKSIVLNKVDFKTSLEKQKKIIEEQAEKLTHVANLMKNLNNQLELENPVDWKTVPKIMDVIRTKEANTQGWYENYLTKEELAEDAKVAESRSTEYWAEYTKRWEVMFKEVEGNLHTDPEGDVGMELAKKWLGLVEEVYPQPSSLRNKLWEAYKSGIIPEDRMPYNQEVIVYITKATKKYKILRGY
ncbi:MAG: hypothetical protein K0S27_736 [Gammaproteobacteria bacterium]|jgi:DNA-binding transcriptional MerR regulator|nr:hypothetical protein [Gammaproteobacteria bacterium]